VTEGDALSGDEPKSVAELPTPFFVAHRGMANLFPENTLEAYTGSAALGIDVIDPDTSSWYNGALQGWACPIRRNTGKGPISITFSVRMDAASTSSAWVGAFVCAVDDRSFDDLDDQHPGLGGYHIRLRQSGDLEMCVVDDGMARLVARSATSAIDPGGVATIRVDITRTRVAATRLDSAPPTTIAVADASHRGGYLHLGRRGAAVRFSGVTIG